MPAALFIFPHLNYLSYKTIAILYFLNFPLASEKVIPGNKVEDFHEISNSL